MASERSQSLLHQRTVSDAQVFKIGSHGDSLCLNRFFISEQFPTCNIGLALADGTSVSIASSSANSFRLMNLGTDAVSNILSQSLLHQRTVSDSAAEGTWVMCKNPSQSLLHQRTVSDSSGSRRLANSQKLS